MNEIKVSILILNIDRYWMGRYVLENNFANCGIPLNQIELLVLDNGSTDKRAIEYLSGISDVFIQKDENIGVSKGYNELFRIAKGEYICLPANDILMGQDWLKDLIYYQNKIKNSGLCGIYCEGDKGRIINVSGKAIWQRENNTLDGVTLFHRKMFEIVGGFDESYGRYGYEDNDYAARIGYSGYINYYIPFQYSTHFGYDFNRNTEYRINKNKEAEISRKIFYEKLKAMAISKNYKIPL